MGKTIVNTKHVFLLHCFHFTQMFDIFFGTCLNDSHLVTKNIKMPNFKHKAKTWNEKETWSE